MTSSRRIATPVLATALGLTIACGAGAAMSAGSASASQPAAATQTRDRPLNILLTNDDGWRGPGGSTTPLIVAVRDALVAAGHHVVVVAPGTDQSGQGGRISLPPQRLTVEQPERDVWTVSPGSPSDTVYFALDQVFAGRQPDLVVSGINPGNNAGTAVNHSGTVNAAMTASELGIPSMAVSLDTPSLSTAATAAARKNAGTYVARLVRRLQETARRGPLTPRGVTLNVNLPVRPGPADPTTGTPGSVLPPRGERITTLATTPFIDFGYANTTGAAGAPGTYDIRLAVPNAPASGRTDVGAVQDGYVSLTPLDRDRDLDRSTTTWLRRVLLR